MGNELRKIGNTGVMIKKGYKRGDEAFDKVLGDILSGKHKAQLEEKGKSKKEIDKLLAKKLKERDKKKSKKKSTTT